MSHCLITQELAPGTEVIDRRNADVRETLKGMTNNHGPDVGIEAAGFHYAKGIVHKVWCAQQSECRNRHGGVLPMLSITEADSGSSCAVMRMGPCKHHV